ncbi:MAG: DNA polymerase III subunit delta [Rhodospirillales bacterium]|nr:DNA polymerase III subunit delta [Rhodospirillales bacterium]
MKIDGRGIAGFVKRPDPAARVVLVYGPDAGLVRERAEAIARTVVSDLADPFAVAELSPDTLKDDPARLSDEAAAIPMLGGRRVVRVRGAGNESLAAVKNLLDDPKGDGLVVIEAGELESKSALRKLCEGADNAAAIACYRDEGADLSRTIADSLSASGISADSDALEWLTMHLGGDRAITRSEIEKLSLYVGAGKRASVEDCIAVIGDSADIDLDDVIRATAGGDMTSLDRAYARISAEGDSSIGVLRMVSRHFQRLQMAQGEMARGLDADAAMGKLRPPVFWKEKTPFKSQLSRWPLPRLTAALERLLEAEIQCKSSGMPAELVAQRCLMALAQMAAQAARR